MRTDADRSEKYTAKYVATTVGLKVASSLATMKSNFATTAATFVATEIAIQGILNDKGIRSHDYPFYLNFGREVEAKRNKGISGAALDNEATDLHAKYVTGYGLDGATIIQIALDVFGLTIP